MKQFKQFLLLAFVFFIGCIVQPKSVEAETLGKPVLVSAVNNTSAITVTWNRVSNAGSYCIYRREAGAAWKRVAIVNQTTQPKYVDKAVSAGKTYIYTVRSYKNGKFSDYNHTGISCVRLTRPALSTIQSTASGMKITWKQVAGAKGYYIFRKKGTSAWSRIGTVSGATRVFYTDTNVSMNVKYSYTVRAFSGKHMSVYNTTGIGATYYYVSSWQRAYLDFLKTLKYDINSNNRFALVYTSGSSIPYLIVIPHGSHVSCVTVYHYNGKVYEKQTKGAAYGMTDITIGNRNLSLRFGILYIRSTENLNYVLTNPKKVSI